jgi:hypothetical protein
MSPPPEADAVYLSFQHHLERILADLPPLVRRAGNSRLEECLPGWQSRFSRLADEAKEPAQVTVALLGTAGAGKSTLINTLVGEEVLATKVAGSACTAVPCELSWSAESSYTAEVLYLSDEEWPRERERLLRDLAATQGEKDEESRRLRTEVWQTLRAVCGLPEGTGPDDIDPTSLKESEGAQGALRKGSEKRNDPNPADLLKQIQPFLTSETPYWPLIKRVRVFGPFPGLPRGVVLVDLPGTNDPNQAREAVTRRYLHTATNV